MTKAGFTGDEYRTTMVCVDYYHNGETGGRIYNPCIGGAETFENLTQLLLMVDSLLDKMNFPQSFEAKREFGPISRPEHAPENAEMRNGRAATFAVKVMFRQNASWQGSVSWLEGGMEESFRSALELIFLMDSALNNSDT